MPDALMHYVITSNSYGLFYNNVEYFPGSEIAQWAHRDVTDDRQMKFKYVGTVDGAEGEYFVSTGTTWVKKLFLFPTFIDKGSVGTTAQPDLPQATEENRNWCYKVATTKKYRIGQDQWITIDFKYMEYVAKSSDYESMSPVKDQHKNSFFSNEYTTIEYDCIQIRFTQTPPGYYKYSATCWYNGKAHKDIYFNGHYHDALWLYKLPWNCDGYEWKKFLTNPRYSGHYLLADHQYVTTGTTYRGIGEVTDDTVRTVRNNYRYYSTRSSPQYRIIASHKLYDSMMGNIIIVPFLDISNVRNYRVGVMVYYGIDGGRGLHRSLSSFYSVGGEHCYMVSCWPGGVTFYCEDDKKFYNIQIFTGGRFGQWTNWNAASGTHIGTINPYERYRYADCKYYADGRSIGLTTNNVTYRYDPSNRDTFDEIRVTMSDQEEVPIPFPQDPCLRELAYKMFEGFDELFIPKGYTFNAEGTSFIANGYYYTKATYRVSYSRTLYYDMGSHQEILAQAYDIRDSILEEYNPGVDYLTSVAVNDDSYAQTVTITCNRFTTIFVGYNAYSDLAVSVYDLHDISVYREAQSDLVEASLLYSFGYPSSITTTIRTYYVNGNVYLYMSFLSNVLTPITGEIRPLRDIYVIRVGNPEMEVMHTYANGSTLNITNFTDSSQPNLQIAFDGWLGDTISGFTPEANSFGNWAAGYAINATMTKYAMTPDPEDQYHYPGDANDRLMLSDGTRMIMSTQAVMNTLSTTWYNTSQGA